MHRSIGGLADALQSIADGKASLNAKKKRQLAQEQLDTQLAANLTAADIESNKRMNDANMHYFDIESCTSRIAARLRDIDNINLNNHPLPDFGDSAVSNQMKFIDDQCFRAQSLLSGEFYMRNLHSEEVHKNMIELDERINFTAKNWKHALVEMGIQENELTELRAPAVEAAEDLRPVESDSKKVRRNSVMTQTRPTVVAAEADYSTYNTAEFNELNEIIKQFMDQAFISGTNGVQVSKEVMERCNNFKQKMLNLTNQLVEKQKLTIRTSMRETQKKARAQESEIALLHSQNEEADIVIRSQKESDKQIRRLVEAKFADSIRKIKEHTKGIEEKLESQEEANGGLQKRFVEVQGMFDDLSRQRLYTDPFLRRRAENLVKGLLRNLNESELKEQEEREEQMQSSYQQWKKIIEFCAEKERQLGLMDTQEQTLRDELEAQKKRIEQERTIYRDKARLLTAKDTEQSNKLLILEEQISDRARDERRKLHVEHRDGSRPASQQMKLRNPAGESFSDSDSVRSGRGTAPQSPNRSVMSHLGPTSPISPSALRDAGSASDSDSSSVSSVIDINSTTNPENKVPKSNKVKQSSRVKQKGLRAVTSLVDDYTEGILGITYEHTKRQEISSNVHDHIPRPAPGHITGSEASDNALLSKAQKIIAALHPAPDRGAPQSNSNAVALKSSSETAVVPIEEEAWTFGTNSAPRTPKTPTTVRFGSPGRRQSAMNSSKAPFGFWADREGAALEESSSEDDNFGGGEHSTSKKQKALEVYSLSSTACYVSLYYRYLKKFPNLNFKRSNPRLEEPSSIQFGEQAADVIGDNPQRGNKKASELVKDNSRFQFSIREAVVVIKEALDSLLQCRCIDKIIVTDALENLAELERRMKLASLPGVEKEVRYQLHFLCVSLIHTTMNRAPRTLLVKNNRKYFVEISTTVLALLGIVLNCTLVFWQPSVLDKGSRCAKLCAEGGIIAERVEFICAHLIELVITLGDVDAARPLSSGRSSPAPRRASAVTTSKTFKVKKAPDTPLGPAGFISLLRGQTSELLRKPHEEENAKPPSSPTSAANRAGSKSPFGGHKGVGVNYRDMFEVFNKIVDDEGSVTSAPSDNSGFTMKHRHAILSLQLFLYLALNNTETTMDEAILTLHKGIIDGNNSVRADASNVIPCDVDILLQQMHPAMVPAVLVLELIRRVLEEEFHRVGFLEKIANSDKEVADLQFLNVQFSSGFDVGLKKGRDGLSSNTSHKSQTSTTLTAVSPQMSLIDASAPAPKRLAQNIVLSGQPAPVAEKQYPPLHISHFKTTKEVHLQWVEDLELHLHQLGEDIVSLIRPATVALREPSFVPSRVPAPVQTETPRTAAIPLPDVLVYKVLAHINNLKSITASHSVNGLARVQALQSAFLQIMRDLFAARSKIIAIVTAMTWPMRKKIDWLKLKYNTILEENGATNDQVADYQELVERYQRDIDAYKTSIQLIEKEKNTLDYRRTKMLMLDHHDPQIQQLIIEHATDEYSSKFMDFKARETRLTTTISHLSHEFDLLSAQHDTLKAAQRSLDLIDVAQDTLEIELDNQPLPRQLSDFSADNNDPEKPLTAEEFELNLRLTPKVPPVMGELISAVDDFMKRERLSEVAVETALPDGMSRVSVSAKQAEERARTSEMMRQKEKQRAESAQSGPRMPLFGAQAVLQPRPEQPALPPKLFGFAKRIDGGLQAVGTLRSNLSQKTPTANTSLKINTTFSTSEKFGSNQNPNTITSVSQKGNLNTFTATTAGSSFSHFLNEKSTDTVTSELDLGSFIDTTTDNRAFSTEEQPANLDNYADLFGQPTPISLRDRIERGYLRKHSSTKAKNTKLRKVANQFMWNNSGKTKFNHAEILAGPPPDSPLLTPNVQTSLSVAGEPALCGQLSKKPDLDQKKNHAFMSALDRTQPFRYDEIVEHDFKTNFTPLNIRKLIDTLREEQSEEMASRRALSPYVDLLPATGSAGADRGIGSAFRPGSGIEYDDMYEEFDEEDFEQDRADSTDGVQRFHKSHHRGGSNRDQNMGNGVTYAEYLVWKTKRKQQQQGGQPLEALKNSINIQLRSARRVYAADASDEPEDEPEEEPSPKGPGDNDLSLDEENETSTQRDYSKSNSEVNFILSRSSSRVDSIAAKKRKHSSNRSPSVGSSLHFHAPVSDTDSTALIEAERRARGENVPSARASLSIRSRASLIGKLSRALDGMDNPSDIAEQAVASPGTRTARSSMARQSMVRPLATIIERRTSQARGSLYKPATAPPPSESKLEEARVLAHSIIHGRVLESPNKAIKSFEKTNPNFDMQILDYIANDHLIIKGWERVDLLKMNDNETFAGHSFKFDDHEEKLRISTLKQFTSQVANDAENSAFRVESEYKEAIVNLNRLVGKKNTDIAEIEAMTSARELAQSQPASAEKVPLEEEEQAKEDTFATESGAQEVDAEQPVEPAASVQRTAVYTLWPSSTDRLDSPESLEASRVASPEALGFPRSDSTIGFSRSESQSGLQIVTTRVTFEDIGLIPEASNEATGDGPHRPAEPKPSASFSSPHRRSKISESKY